MYSATFIKARNKMKTNLVSWKCQGCGMVEDVLPYIARNRKFCSADCANKNKTYHKGKNSPHYKGGWVHSNGYHYTRHGGKYVLTHRLVYEKHHGIRLLKGFAIHHKNGDKLDNRVENLQLMTTGEHSRMHLRKLSVIQIEDAKRLYSSGKYTHQCLGVIFGINKSQVSRMLKMK